MDRAVIPPVTGDDAAAVQAAPLVIEMEDYYIGAGLTGGLALLTARAGALAVAAQRAGHSAHFYAARQTTMDPTEQLVWDALMAQFDAAAAAGTLPAAMRLALMAQGAALSLREVLDLKLGL